MAASGTGCICVNGRLLAPHEATVSALDAGFLLGDGLFESLRAEGGTPYLLERHLDRLYAGAEAVGFARMPARAELAAQVHATLARAALDDAYLRITLTRGRGGPPPALPTSPLPAPLAGSGPAPLPGSPTPSTAGPPTVVIAALPAPPRSSPANGIAVALIGSAPERGPKAKSTSRQHAVTARGRAERAGAAEGVYVSRYGRVLEATSSNVFAVGDGRLLTPPPEDCLPGVTRGRLIELARAHGLETIEAPLGVDVLKAAEEAFLTNAVQGMRAIASVDGHPIGMTRGDEVDGHPVGAGRGDEAFGKGGVLDGKGGVCVRKGGVCEPERGVFAVLLSLYEEDRAAASDAVVAGLTSAAAAAAAAATTTTTTTTAAGAAPAAADDEDDGAAVAPRGVGRGSR